MANSPALAFRASLGFDFFISHLVIFVYLEVKLIWSYFDLYISLLSFLSLTLC